MINVFNLRGNQRTSGELSRREGGKIFGSGSRTPIAITLLVRNPAAKGKAQIHYHDIGDYLSREEKLERIKKFASVMSPEMQLSSITPNEDNDWLNQRDGLFDTFIPIGDKDNKDGKTVFVPFYSRGCASARDAWVYNFSIDDLKKNISSMIDFYNDQIRTLRTNQEQKFDFDSTKISWSDTLKQRAAKKLPLKFDSSLIATAMYRPFCKQAFYYDKPVLERTYQLPRIFPTPQTKNLVICVSGIGVTKEFSAIITDIIPDLELIGKSQCFPLYYYESVDHDQLGLFDRSNKDYIRRDGVSDFILGRAKTLNPKITKEDIFYYVYGLLHSKEYKKRFSSDLKKSLPHIPFPEDFQQFKAFSKAGRDLAQLHLNYEDGEPCKEVIVSGVESGNFHVSKMRFISKEDKRTIIFNESIRVENIPLAAYDYIVNGKSAIEWAMERYAITINPESKIVNDPNQCSENPRYILELLLRLIQTSINTMKIVAKLPALNFPD